MIKQLNKKSLQFSAAIAVGMMASADTAHATGTAGFENITQNIGAGLQSLPGLLAVLSYIGGLALGTLGILKIKDHVENPGNTPLKDGAIRLVAGGALLALPMMYEAMVNTIGQSQTNTGVSQQIGNASAGVVW